MVHQEGEKGQLPLSAISQRTVTFYSLYTSSPSLSIQIILIPILTLIHDPFHSIQALYFVLEVHNNIKIVTMCIQKQKKCIYCTTVRRYPVQRVFIISLASCDVKVTSNNWVVMV